MTSRARLLAPLPIIALIFCAGTTFAQYDVRNPTLPAVSSASAAAPEYTIKLLAPNGMVSFYPVGLTNSGEVLGDEYDGPFIYQNGAISSAGIEGPYNAASAINDAGDIVGSIASRAFVHSGGQLRFLDLPQPMAPYSAATGINDVGQIVGYTALALGRTPQGFVYQNGKTISLFPNELPLKINNLGEIAGTSGVNGFFSTHGFTFNIPSADGYVIVPTGLDTSGRVSGYTSLGGNIAISAFIYSAGKLNVIPNPPNVKLTIAQGMNDCGEIVGFNDLGAFIYQRGMFKQLGYLLTQAPYNSFEPVAINNSGEIVGEVTINDVASTMIMVPTVPETCGTDASIVNTAASSIVGPGEEITYTVEAENITASATHFTVRDTISSAGNEARLSSCTVSGGGSCSISTPDRLTAQIDLPDLAKGSTATITLGAKIGNSAGDEQPVLDTATLSSSATADYLSTAYADIRLTADASVSASLVSNDSGLLHYLATVTDLGPDRSHADLLLDPLPANTSFISASTDYGDCTFYSKHGPNGTVRCRLGNLGYLVPAHVNITLKASPAACPSVSNTFSLSSQSIDTNSSNDSSTVVTPLSGAACISGLTSQ